MVLYFSKKSKAKLDLWKSVTENSIYKKNEKKKKKKKIKPPVGRTGRETFKRTPETPLPEANLGLLQHPRWSAL